MTIFYLLVECVALYPFKDSDTSLPMLTAGQVLTLPVSQDECAGILLKSTVRKALRSVAAKLLLISLLIAVIGSFSSAAVQVRQVLCSDQGAILDPQLWQSDPWWFPTWESTQALHGFAPGLQESPGYRRPSRVLYMQMNGWMNSGMNEWKISKPIWSTKCWNHVCPWMAIWQWTWVPVTRKSCGLTGCFSSYLVFVSASFLRMHADGFM